MRTASTFLFLTLIALAFGSPARAEAPSAIVSNLSGTYIIMPGPNGTTRTIPIGPNSDAEQAPGAASNADRSTMNGVVPFEFSGVRPFEFAGADEQAATPAPVPQAAPPAAPRAELAGEAAVNPGTCPCPPAAGAAGQTPVPAPEQSAGIMATENQR